MQTLFHTHTHTSTGLTHAQVAYYDSGFTGFSDGSTHLANAGTSLEVRFKFCSTNGGILLYATDTSGSLYFALGVNTMRQLYIESNNGGNLLQVMHREFYKKKFFIFIMICSYSNTNENIGL